jgi:hypothetical protein
MTLPGGTGYGYNEATHQYYSLTSGRFVSRETLAEGLQSMMDTSAVNMNALTQSLIDNQITLANWQTGMMTEIKNTNVASAALANGGWANMTQSDWGATGQLIREQYDYLRGYAKDIANGTQALDGRALVRSDLYADAANSTFWEMDKRSHLLDGYDIARRVLEVKDDGNCDGCIEAAAEGWLPIDEVLPIGDAECMTRCRCSIEYRRAGDE